jgi:hypothetical protein
MKLSLPALAAIAAIFLSLSLSAQDDAAIENLMKEQFYGNRIKAGTVLLNGAFRYTGFQNDIIERFVGEVGIGLGLGITERFVFNIGYNRTQEYLEGFDQLGQPRITSLVGNSFNIGMRYLPNTVAGFVQFYTGADFFTQSYQDTDPRMGNSVFTEESIGLNFPFGVIFWVSTWMAITVEPVNLTLSQPADSGGNDGELNFGMSTFNPQFGFTFALGSRKPN